MTHRARGVAARLAFASLIALPLAGQDPAQAGASSLGPSQVWEVVVDDVGIGEAMILAVHEAGDAPKTLDVMLTAGSVVIYQRFYAAALAGALRRKLRDVDRIVGPPRPDSIPVATAVAVDAGRWLQRQVALANRLGAAGPPAEALPEARLHLDRTQPHPTFAAGQIWRWKRDPKRLLSVVGTGRSDELGWIVEVDVLLGPAAPGEPLPRTAILAEALENAVGEQLDQIDRPPAPATPVASVGFGTLFELEAAIQPWSPSADDDQGRGGEGVSVARIVQPPGSFAFVRWRGRNYGITNLTTALAAAKTRGIEIHTERGDPYSLVSRVVDAVAAAKVQDVTFRTKDE